MQAVELMEQNLHRSEEGMNLLVSLSEGMNSLRKDYSKMPPIHIIKGNSEFIPLDGNYINGFIAGDGNSECQKSLSVVSNDKKSGSTVIKYSLGQSLFRILKTL